METKGKKEAKAVSAKAVSAKAVSAKAVSAKAVSAKAETVTEYKPRFDPTYRGKLTANLLVTRVAEENPKREGSKSWERFNLYPFANGKGKPESIAALRKRGITDLDLRWDFGRGFTVISDGKKPIDRNVVASVEANR